MLFKTMSTNSGHLIRFTIELNLSMQKVGRDYYKKTKISKYQTKQSTDQKFSIKHCACVSYANIDLCFVFMYHSECK